MNDSTTLPRADTDLLYGVPAIAAFLKIRQRQAYHLIETAGLPTFRMGRKLCSRESIVSRWLEEQSAAAR